jgi:3-hydroxybutyrate dehydrogenase
VLGGADVIVNNAGIQFVSSTQAFPDDKWNLILQINLTAAFHLTRAALPKMLAQRWGRVINIASVHGLVASVNKSAYVASKHGLIGFTKTVALETAGTGVTSNAICPGWVLTPLVQKQVDARAAQLGLSQDDARKSLLSEKQPSNQFVTPEQLGGLAAFLCSDAAAQITGVAIPMDGGWTSQ